MVTIGGHSKLSRLYSIVVKKEWRARGYGARARGYGTPMILVSAPVPLGQIGFYNLLGLGWGFGTKGLGTGLDNIVNKPINIYVNKTIPIFFFFKFTV